MRFLIFILYTIFFIVMALCGSYLIQDTWNSLIPVIPILKPITYRQAFEIWFSLYLIKYTLEGLDFLVEKTKEKEV